ncbi:hypothetical protein ACFFRR_008916 [Megaselia abdita]
MKQALFVCSLVFVFIDFVKSQEDRSNLYTKRYENLDIDSILRSPRLVTNYVDCLLNKKPCPPEGKELKKILPEALRTKCGRCYPSQKETALKVITVLYEKYPDHYKALREKWDPTGEYNRRFEEYLRDQQFNAIGSSADLDNGPQRPPREGSTTTTTKPNEEPFVSNRFGEDEEDDGIKDALAPQEGGGGYTYSTPTVVVTSTPVRPRPPSTIGTRPTTTTPRPSRKPSTGEQAASNTITSTTLYPNQPFGHPVMDIINKLSYKIANTAEFIAGMLRAAAPQNLDNQSVVVASQNFHKRLQTIVQNQQKILFRKTVVIH